MEHVNKCGDLLEGPCAFVFFLGAFTDAGLCFKDGVSSFFCLRLFCPATAALFTGLVSFGDLCCGLLWPAAAALFTGLVSFGDLCLWATVACRCRLVYRPCLLW